MIANTKWVVGESVMVEGPNHKQPYMATISKVGRSYFYVTRYSQEVKFSIEDGHEAVDYAHDRAWTMEEWVAKYDRAQALHLIANFGLSPTYAGNSLSLVSTDTLQAIGALLQESRDIYH